MAKNRKIEFSIEKSLGSTVPPPFRPFVIPGQIPDRRLRELRALTAMPSRRMNLVESTHPCFTPERVVEGLGLSRGLEISWAQHIAKAMGAANELVMRQDLMSRMFEERMDPDLRRALFSRSMSLWREKGRMAKSVVSKWCRGGVEAVSVVTVEDLVKAATPIGGKTKGGYTVKLVNGKRVYVKEEPKKSKIKSKTPLSYDVRQKLLNAIANHPETFLKKVENLIGEDFNGAIGIRGDIIGRSPGDHLPKSQVWEDGDPTGEFLSGTSAVEVTADYQYDPRDLAIKNLKQVRNATGYGDDLYVVVGDPAEGGEDIGEIIIPNARVLVRIQDLLSGETKKKAKKLSKGGFCFVEPLVKAGPFIGPRGGKWKDAAHKIPWGEEKGKKHKPTLEQLWTGWKTPKDSHSRYIHKLLPGVTIVDEGDTWSATFKGGKTPRFRAKMGVIKWLHENLEKEKLIKAEPRGGTYVKRVPKAGGGYRYFYDEDKYRSHDGAHVSGDEAAETAITKAVAGHIRNAGKAGCELATLKPLAKRYGAEMVGGMLNQACGNGGSLRYEKRRLFAKSECFVLGEWLVKAGPYIGPRGGKWKDPEHTVHWEEGGAKPATLKLPVELKVPYAPMAKAKFRKEMDRRRGDGLMLSGNTFAYKELIKQAGGVWDRYDKHWLMPTKESVVWFREKMMAKAPTGIRTTPTSKQVDYASDLVNKAVDADAWSRTTIGRFDPPTKEQLSKWPGDEVSALIDDIRGMGPLRPRKTEPVGKEKPTAPKAISEDEENWSISAGSGYGHRGWVAGQTFRTSELQRKHHKGMSEFVTVVSAKKTWFSEDGLSFGVGDDEGHVYTAKVRPASEEEADPVKKKIAAAERIRAAESEVAEIAKQIDTQGEYPEGNQRVEGERLFDTGNIYGGGSWFVIAEKHVWHVVNNGADGDNWSRNNIGTGGAGAIGRRVPRDDALVTKLRTLHTELQGGGRAGQK